MKLEVLPPLYVQIKNHLLRKITNDEYDEHSKLPSERKLSQKFDVSRMTARKALNELVNEGYVYREAGRGTFVAGKKIERDFIEINGFTEHLKNCGINGIETEVITKKIIEVDNKIAEKLNVNTGTKCYKIVRLRKVSNNPISIQYAYLAVEKFNEIIKYDLKKESLYQIIQEYYNCNITKATSKLELRYLDEYNAKLLKLSKKMPVFKINQVAYDNNNNVIEYCQSLNRTDVFSYAFEITK
ncbi:GntR family transcriptional regulator [Sporohalobacter salinus]|uniref:GntR family transcriptional regulator n=1 Tax=Sporohalobacter salinus TaxID=1494606 RepID=UPI00195F5CAE|nr:GntR family transcriptional regulator [Sporohalobacter salinus]MBM7624937.1 GntR family transcriptional regulator [Sporohalobacter salinus]